MNGQDPVAEIERAIALVFAIARGLIALALGLYGLACVGIGLAAGDAFAGLLSGFAWCGLACVLAPRLE